MILILNLVLCAAVIAMVVTPLARAIAGSRPQSAGTSPRRELHAVNRTRAIRSGRGRGLGAPDTAS